MRSTDQQAVIRPVVFGNSQRQVSIPRVQDLPDKNIEKQMNRHIKEAVLQLMKEQEQYQTVDGVQEVLAGYEIKNNQRRILSLTLFNYTYTYPMAHGMTLMTSLTFNLQTGQLYTLKSLFESESNYVKLLSEQVEQQITAKELPLLEPFTTIKPEQSFYLADKTLVLYFQIYEITPYYVGIPTFPILIEDLEDILAPDSPLQWLLPAIPSTE